MTETSELALEELEARITELCGHLNAAQYRWLLLIREFDRRRGWGDGKLASCAHWLNFKCGLNLGAAREKVRVAHALEAALAQVPEREVCVERVEEWPLSGSARRADALVRMAESALKGGGRDARSAEHYQVVIHVDAESLSAGAAGRAEVEGGPPLAVETIRRLGCDASVVGVIEEGQGHPLSVGRRTRSIPPSIRRALRSRDESGCQFPGCTYDKYLDAHHIEHWAEGGKTELSNLVTLCRWHHRLVHEGGSGCKSARAGAGAS
jgi:hypothetical protein